MATFSTAIAASSDDAHQTGTSMNLTNVSVVCEAATSWGGFRWDNVTVPKDATINSAYIRLYTASTTYDSPDVVIYCEDADDAATFTTSSSNISGRPLTTANVAWQDTDIGGTWQNSIDISAPIQEVVNRAGWASGNALVVIMDGQSTSPWRIRAWDNGTGHGAVINIDYTEAAAGTAVPVIVAHLKAQGFM